MQQVTQVVAPADLRHEAVPDKAVLVAPRDPAGVRPGEDLLVASARQRPPAQVAVGDAKEPAAARVEKPRPRLAEVVLVLGRKRAAGLQAELVEHPAEDDDAADLGVWASQSDDAWHGLKAASPQSRRRYTAVQSVAKTMVGAITQSALTGTW